MSGSRHKFKYQRQSSRKCTAFDWPSFIDRSHSLRLLRRTKVRVDTLLQTQDGFCEAIHWQVISALCPKLILASETTRVPEVPNSSVQKQIKLPRGVTRTLAHLLVSCAYGEQVSLSKITLLEFYQLAVEYRIEHVIKICLHYAKSLLNVCNCVQMLHLSLKHRHHGLRRASYSTIRSNFKLVLQVTQDFHLLPGQYLRYLLLDDYLKLNEDEEFAWLAIVRWLGDRLISPTELMTVYNEMIIALPVEGALPDQSQREPSGVLRSLLGRIHSLGNISQPVPVERQIINFHSPSAPFCVSIVNMSRRNSDSLFTISELDISETKDDEKLHELMKCLRFMRFKSVRAFDVILSHPRVQKSDRLSYFVSLMRLRYVMRKSLPLDENDVKLVSARGIEQLRLGETPRSRRTIMSLKRMVRSSLAQRPVDPIVERTKGEDANDLQPKLMEDQLGDVDLALVDSPRIPTTVALLFGGWYDGAVSNSILSYDFVCDRWFKLKIRLPEPRAFHASCCSRESGQIFIFGGTNGTQILDSVIRFDPALDVSGNVQRSTYLKGGAKRKKLEYRFHGLRSMLEPRCHLSGLFHSDRRLYALGGHNGSQRLRSGERYDVASNQWHPIAEMTLARSDASACSHNNKIYIAGGQVGDQFIQSSVEFYKATDDTWTFAAPMIVPRMSFRLVSYKNQLFALGGTSGLVMGDEIPSLTKSVERYNPSLSTWAFCAPMNEKRSSFDTMLLEDKLIVVGGCGEHKRLKTCEALQIGRLLSAQSLQVPPATDGSIPQMRQFPRADSNLYGPQRLPPVQTVMRWVAKGKLPVKRSGFSIAVVGQLKNARAFTYHGSTKQTHAKGKVCVIKRPGRWHKFKIIKRRKLIKNLKIALVITIVILLM